MTIPRGLMSYCKTESVRDKHVLVQRKRGLLWASSAKEMEAAGASRRRDMGAKSGLTHLREFGNKFSKAADDEKTTRRLRGRLALSP
jgi:hypothetical protein